MKYVVPTFAVEAMVSVYRADIGGGGDFFRYHCLTNAS